MKILVVPSWYTTEEKPLAGIFFKEHAEALARYGHEVAVLYIDVRRSVPKESRGVTVRIVNGVKEFRYNNLNFTPKFAAGVNWQKHIRSRKMFRVIEKQFGIPEVVHLESCEAVRIAQKARKRWNIPVVYTEHLSTLVSGVQLSYYEKMFFQAISSSDACVAISDVFWNKMSEFKNSGVYRIANGIATGQLIQSNPGKIFKIKALGSLRRIKGYDILIRAFNEFAQERNDVQLVIGGAGEEREHLEQLIDSLHCSDNVELVGNIPRENVPHFYSDCSVFVCSSWTETFSIVTAEALCSGIPVVATKCGGPEDMIDKNNGILVDVGNVKQMTQALETIYKNFGSYNRKNIQETAKSKFDYEIVVRQHEKLYERVQDEYSKKR